MSWKDPRSRRDIVYLLLSCVPPGYTITYKALAELVDTTPRAIGAYMRANRELIVVPCHRVVAKSGLGGFSKGVHIKERLLRIEGSLSNGKPLRVIKSAEEYWKVLETEGYTCCAVGDP